MDWIKANAEHERKVQRDDTIAALAILAYFIFGLTIGLLLGKFVW